MAALKTLCREIAVAMTERPSVTGTPDEASFGPWLATYLAGIGHFGDAPEIWAFPVAKGDARLCVAMLVRRSGSATILLTGHYDTVTTADYGDLMPLATQPDALAAALALRLRDAKAGTAGARARDDLASGRYLPGRGLLDMKAGLAAGLACMASFAGDPAATGNLLFIAVPDEENASAGARRAAAELKSISASRDLVIKAVINLDAIADDGDGTAGQVIALGSVGKVLPTAFVVGTPVHSGFPLRGVNAGVLAAAIALRMEWAPELTDESTHEPGTPVSLLSLKDGKVGYDVTTPATAFATWSVLNYRRHPSAVLKTFEMLVHDALESCLASLRGRAAQSGQIARDIPPVAVLSYSELLEDARRVAPEIDVHLNQHAADLRGAGMSQPEISQALTASVWRQSGRVGPAVVLGLGSTPYLAVQLDDEAVVSAVQACIAEAPQLHGVSLRAVEFFAGISDMSFFGQGETSELETLAAQTPGWETCIALDSDSLAGVPTINVGPWGRDYHTPLERIETIYGFDALPGILINLCARLLETRPTKGFK
jgi:arginine utilization protein RocB